MNTAVLLPVYNAEKFLPECLDAILSQTYTDFELFACNDGSTDSSLLILHEYAKKDTRVHVLDNPQNLGVLATRNNLISKLPDCVEFVAWIDADDVMFPDRLQRQSDYLKSHPEIGGVGSSLEIIDETSRVTGHRHYPETPEEIRSLLPKRNVLAQPAIMLRKDIITRCGAYASACSVCEDYEYWLRCLEYTDFANLKEPVLRYRISSTQIKQTSLKQTLCATLKIQNDYYRRTGKSRPFMLLLQHLAAHVLLLFPSTWIMKLFVRVTYRKRGMGK